MLSRLTSYAVLVMVFVLMAQNVLLAQNETDQGLAIRPAIVDEVINPGETTEIELQLENITTNPIAIEASVEPMIVNDPIINIADEIRFDVSKWVEFEQSTWALDAFENISVVIRITPPEDATPGGHYAQLTFRAIEEQTDTTTTSAEVIPQINSLLLLTVPGDVITDIDIAEIEASDYTFNTAANADSTVVNKGNSHEIIRVAGILRIGEEIQRFENEPRIILPGTSQNYPVELKSSKLFAKAQVWTEITFGSPSETVSSEITEVLFVSPYLLLTVIFTILGLFSFVGRRSKSKVYSHVSKRSHSSRKYSHPRSRSERNIIRMGR